MGFIQPCYIKKNTPELRKKLESLGYSLRGKLKNFSRIYCKRNTYSTPSLNEKPPKDYYIDCGENEDLFLAIAALRDDSDIHQYFVLDIVLYNINPSETSSFKVFNKGDFIKCNSDSWFIDLDESGKPSMLSSRNIPAHKASVEELIKYFKR